ncbi:DUF2806 domain-containing protein [Rhodanobacter koreensis]
MSDSEIKNSIISIDAKGVSKVGKALIEKVADGIGGLYRPTQIVRVAKAQAKADLITANAAIEVDEFQRRAMQRFVVEEVKRQSNIEAITTAAIPLLDESAEPEKLDDDWISNFFEKSRIVSDTEMQSLWSKVLAGEANDPGKYARRTVNLISDLDKSDAELFSELCGFSWMVNEPKPLVFGTSDEIYRSKGLDFDTLSHLDSLGLIKFDPLSGFAVRCTISKVTITYFGRPLGLGLELAEGQFEIETGNVMFTKAGQQLAEISGSKPVEGFYDHVVKHYKDAGLIFSTSN